MIANPPRTALICTPFYGCDRPSIALGLLKASLERHSFECDVFYTNIWYQELVGAEIYSAPDSVFGGFLVGDWLFSESLWGVSRDSDEQNFAYLHDSLVPRWQSEKTYREFLTRVISGRQAVSSWIQ